MQSPMEVQRDEVIGSLADQGWHDSLFDELWPDAASPVDEDTPCTFLPNPDSVPGIDAGLRYDWEKALPIRRAQPSEDYFSFQPASPQFANSNVSTPSMSTISPALTEGPQQTAEVAGGRNKKSDKRLTTTQRRKRSHSQSSSSKHVPATASASASADPKLRRSRRSARQRRSSTKTSGDDAEPSPPTPTGHNAVEKRYRDNLNAHFDQLLSELPYEQPVDNDGRSLSKASILELAVRTLREYKGEQRALYWQREQLRDMVRSGFTVAQWNATQRAGP